MSAVRVGGNRAGTVYFATNPYHLILTSAIATSDTREKYLIVYPSFKPKGLWSTFESINHPFDNILYINKTYPTKRPNVWIDNTKAVIKTFLSLSDFPVERLYLANHNKPVAQYLIQKTDGDVILIEDGTGAYCPAERSFPMSKWKEFITKFIYGPWWRGGFPWGTHPDIDEYRATFPQLIHHDYTDRPVDGVQFRGIENMMTDWARKYLERVSINLPDNPMGMVILPHSKLIGNNYIERLENIIDALTQNELDIAVKYHTRERNFYLPENHGFLELPNAMPAELLYLSIPNLKVIIGDASTALLSAKWLDLDTTVKYEDITGNGIRSEFSKVFGEIGIEKNTILNRQ